MTAETESETDEETTTETDTETTSTSDRLPDDHPVVKALAKANEEAKAARLKVKEFEDANKSEIEKATAAAAAAEKRAEAAELKALRIDVALEKKIKPQSAQRLQGTTREELEADAERMLEEGFGIDAETSSPAKKIAGRAKPPGSSRKPSDETELDGKERAAAALRQMSKTTTR